MKRIKAKKLGIQKETLRLLDPQVLAPLAGGAQPDSVWDPGCGMHTTMCPDRSLLSCLTQQRTLCVPSCEC